MQGGMTVVMKETFLLCTLNMKRVFKSKKDLESLVLGLKEKKGEKSFEGESVAIMEPWSAAWIPFGYCGFLFALDPRRPTRESADDVLKKQGDGNKRRRGKTTDDTLYGSTAWIPAMSCKDAASADAKLVTWLYSHLARTRVDVSKRWQESSGYNA